MGRLDWWRIKGEHTPYQWACQLAMYSVAPFGERRSDMRSALNTTIIRNAVSMSEVTAEQSKAVFDALAAYVPGDQEDVGLEVDSDILAKLNKG